ncbi:MAG: glycogen synthase GlgA [Chlorobiaceae bacterium]|nr:glycogen synthase GlgA [Chlorobiaceae bacterium]MBA4308802.1 glycogen synthase GlgA [Chlorobiaceae bacterium]
MSSSKRLRILFVTPELFPFVKTGGLADVSSALPQMLTELGHEVRILVPKYGAIDSRKYKIHDVVRLKDIAIKIGEKKQIFSLKSSFLPSQRVRVQIYFLDNQDYYGSRKSLYSDPLTGVDYKDNDERYILMARAVFELIQRLGWTPDVIHCNDWQSALIPAYLKTLYSADSFFHPFKTLLTIHNFSYQGIFPKSSFDKTGLPESLNSEKGILHDGKLNYMKAGILYADMINTVSEAYSKEILSDKELSGGLNTTLSKRKSLVHGLLNGIDKNIWNPETDKFIPEKFGLKNLESKAVNKESLVERFGLKFNPKIPVIGMISRLYDSKGIDLLVDGFNDIMKLNVQFVLLGTGEKKYHTAFEKFVKKYPTKFACYLGFNDELAHLIEAGSDLYLMPSRYEPCGLNQMYSLVYGAVPIVRETGGLADTVEKYSEKTGDGNGFMFKQYDSAAMVKEINRAVALFQDNKVWTKIMKNGMKMDFSWQASAKKYIELYKSIVAN